MIVGTLIFPVVAASEVNFAVAFTRGAPGFAGESAPSIAVIAVLPERAALKMTDDSATRAE
jgi:hypothetical protein